MPHSPQHEKMFLELWDKGQDTRLKDYHGGYVRAFNITTTNQKGFFTYEEVMEKAQAFRQIMNEARPYYFDISVAVRVKSIGSWRSGHFTPCHGNMIYIWHPDIYDGRETEDGKLIDPHYSDFTIFIKANDHTND